MRRKKNVVIMNISVDKVKRWNTVKKGKKILNAYMLLFFLSLVYLNGNGENSDKMYNYYCYQKENDLFALWMIFLSAMKY